MLLLGTSIDEGVMKTNFKLLRPIQTSSKFLLFFSKYIRVHLFTLRCVETDKCKHFLKLEHHCQGILTFSSRRRLVGEDSG